MGLFGVTPVEGVRFDVVGGGNGDRVLGVIIIGVSLGLLDGSLDGSSLGSLTRVSLGLLDGSLDGISLGLLDGVLLRSFLMELMVGFLLLLGF